MGSTFSRDHDYGGQISDLSSVYKLIRNSNDGLYENDHGIQSLDFRSICDRKLEETCVGFTNEYRMNDFLDDLQSYALKGEEKRTLIISKEERERFAIQHLNNKKFQYRIKRKKIISSPFVVGFMIECDEAKIYYLTKSNLFQHNGRKYWFFSKKVSYSLLFII